MPLLRDRWEPAPRNVYDAGVSRTRQEFAADCDINKIMKDAVRTGTVPSRTDMARYGDFASAPDFQEAQNIVIKAREQFAAVSSELRNKFDNDPYKFLAWIHSDKFDLEEAQKYGILSEEGSRKVAERISKREADAAAKVASK